jgi:hypothetical protein
MALVPLHVPAGTTGSPARELAARMLRRQVGSVVTTVDD